jgi:UDP-N-acetylmuramoyl-L-alanyl-D-glutamate--2,6-diaminopimelate ligase
LTKTLEEALEGVALRQPLRPEWKNLVVTGVAFDSRKVKPGNLFAAFVGAKTDGRAHAPQARQRGAVAVMSELGALAEDEGPWIEVVHGREALATVCRNVFGPVENRLQLTGVTGTNGKTTFTYVFDALLRHAGKRTGVLGTIGNVIAGEVVKAVNTTPESVDLYELFERLEERGATHVTMEVSSHALALRRVFALEFHTVVFTNLSQDHLDFHTSMEEYFEAKKRLFFANGAGAPRWAVLNQDDAWARQIEPAAPTEVLTYGLDAGAAVRADGITTSFDGLTFRLSYRGEEVTVRSPLMGLINVYNILAACAAGISYGFSLDMIAAGIANCEAVPGRFERVDEGQPFLVIVDYAHTPDALRNAIAVARSLKPKRVITLFGCGGDRDRAKRPLMGMAAAELSDFVVLTSDNPRSEEPLNILNDAMVGLRRHDTPHLVEVDRTTGIRKALREARPGDVVLLAGKGHETYQVLQDKTIDFDDREVARGILKESGFKRKRA